MTTPITGGDRQNPAGIKTLAIRLEPDVHTQLTLIAQLRNSTITDEIRKALMAHIDGIKGSSDLASQAESAMAEIEREAAARREAIAQLFGSDSEATKTRPARGR